MSNHPIKRPELLAVPTGEKYSRVCDGGGGRCSNKQAESDCIVVDGHMFTIYEYMSPLLELGYEISGKIGNGNED